jgi:hypothetical protein
MSQFLINREASLLQQVADEFDMLIGEVHRLAMIFAIFEIDPLKKRYLPVECSTDGENVILSVEGGRVVLTLSMAEKVAVRILNLVKHMKGMKDERRTLG